MPDWKLVECEKCHNEPTARAECEDCDGIGYIVEIGGVRCDWSLAVMIRMGEEAADLPMDIKDRMREWMRRLSWRTKSKEFVTKTCVGQVEQ